MLSKTLISAVNSMKYAAYVYCFQCRALFVSLGGGELKSSIDHPFIEGERLFLLFDPTHNLKNLYNNWLIKSTFSFPNVQGDLLRAKHAHFSNIKQLYAKEESMVLKVGHRLKKAALNPNNIQKTSPQLALCK